MKTFIAADRIILKRYELRRMQSALRVALVTDLHNCSWDELIKLLQSERPDIILCAGDILERHDEDASEWTAEKIDSIISSIGKQSFSERFMWYLDRLTERTGTETHKEEDTAIEFLKEATKIAPLFYSVGNHEWYFTEADRQVFSDYHITLLDNADCDIETKGRKLLIGGLSTRYDLDWLKDFSQKDGFRILMCHHPEYYRKAIQNTELDTFDLIVSGHYHGGQWRVRNRSVYVPRTGLFLKDAVGQFDRLIISAGVANTTRFPRYGNPCELVMIEI